MSGFCGGIFNIFQIASQLRPLTMPTETAPCLSSDWFSAYRWQQFVSLRQRRRHGGRPRTRTAIGWIIAVQRNGKFAERFQIDRCAARDQTLNFHSTAAL